jgi:hypothetical protein
MPRLQRSNCRKIISLQSAEGAIHIRHNGVTGCHRVLSWIIAKVMVTEAAEPNTGGTGREK